MFRRGTRADHAVIAAFSRGVRRHELAVRLSPSYSAVVRSQAVIDGVWESRTAKNPRLFNGTKFRLAGLALGGCQASAPCGSYAEHTKAAASRAGAGVDSAGEDAAPVAGAGAGAGAGGTDNTGGGHGAASTVAAAAQDDSAAPVATLLLGLTDYKSFLGTNFGPDADSLVALGASQGDERRYLADPLGVGAVTCTSDGYVVFLRRSQHVGEAAGMWDVPGGHPEPSVRARSNRVRTAPRRGMF